MRKREGQICRRIPNNLCSCLSLRGRKTPQLSLNCSSDFHQGYGREREREKKKSSFYWWTWKYYTQSMNKVNNTVSHVDTMDPWFGVIRMVPYLHSLSPQKHKPTIIIKKNIRPVQIILQNTWSVLLKIVKVIKNEYLRNYHNQRRP